MKDRLYSGTKRHGRGDDLVAGADAQGAQREVQARGGRIHRDGVGCADVLAEFLFEARRTGSGSQPSRTQGLYDFADLFVADGWAVKGNIRFGHLETPVPAARL